MTPEHEKAISATLRAINEETAKPMRDAAAEEYERLLGAHIDTEKAIATKEASIALKRQLVEAVLAQIGKEEDERRSLYITQRSTNEAINEIKRRWEERRLHGSAPVARHEFDIGGA